MKYIILCGGSLSFYISAMNQEQLTIENKSSVFMVVHYTRTRLPIENASLFPSSTVTISIKKPSTQAPQELIFSWIGGRKKISITTTKDPIVLQHGPVIGQEKIPVPTELKK